MLDVSNAVKFSMALGDASRHAKALATLDVPILFGTKRALSRGAELASLATSDAQRAAALLGKIPEFAGSKDALEAIAVSVRATPLRNNTGTRDTGNVLLQTLDSVRDETSATVTPALKQRLHELLAIPPTDLNEAQISELAHYSKLPQLVREFPVLNFISVSRAGSVPGKLLPTDLPALEHAHLVETQGNTVKTAFDAINAITAKPVAEISRDDWKLVNALTIKYGNDGFGQRQSVGITQRLRDIAAIGEHTDVHHGSAAHTIERWNTRNLPHAEQQQFVKDLVAKHPAEVSADEWAKLQMYLEADQDNQVISRPHTLEGTDSLYSWAHALTAKSASPNSYELTRHFMAWRLNDLAPTQRQTNALALLHRPPHTMKPDDWHTLQGLLDSGLVTSSTPKHLTALPGAPKLSELIEQLATGRIKEFDPKDRYVRKDIGHLIFPPAERYAAVWIHQLDSNLPTHMDAALQRVLNGSKDYSDRLYVIGAAESMLNGTKDYSIAESAEIVRAVLHITEGTNPKNFVPVLEHMQKLAETIKPTNRAEKKLYGETARAVARNIQRMRGDFYGQGFADYPNFSELGTVKSNLALIGSLEKSRALPEPPRQSNLTW